MSTSVIYPTQGTPLGGAAWLLASLGLMWVSTIATGWSFGQPLPWAGWLGALSALLAIYHMCALYLRPPRIELAPAYLRLISPHGSRVIPLCDIARIKRNTLTGAHIRHGALGHDPARAQADLVEIEHSDGRILLRADQFQHLTDFHSFLDTLEAHRGQQAIPRSE